MKFGLLLLSVLALSETRYTKCRGTLPFLEVCAFFDCYLNIAQRDLEFINCDRELRGKPPLNFIAEGKCGPSLTPKCRFFNYK